MVVLRPSIHIFGTSAWSQCSINSRSRRTKFDIRQTKVRGNGLTRRGSDTVKQTALAPAVLGIFALQLLLDLGIIFSPESGQIVCDLDRTMVRREHLNPQRHATLADH